MKLNAYVSRIYIHLKIGRVSKISEEERGEQILRQVYFNDNVFNDHDAIIPFDGTSKYCLAWWMPDLILHQIRPLSL